MTETENQETVADFDITQAQNHTISDQEAAGGKPLYPEDKYRNCRIESVKILPPYPRDAEKGVKWVYEVQFVTEDYESPIYVWMKYKDRNSKKSAFFKLNAAIWPVEADRVGKNPVTDWVNEEVNIMCGVDDFNGNAYNEWSFTTVG